MARHPERPHCQDYIDALFSEWTPLAGDRNFADDHAVMGGLARFNGRAVVVIGHEKGNDTRSRIARNFGMARPEGYRKAIRLMDLADRFSLPVITLVDTPGAYPGKGAEERGQAEAIARSTEKCLQIGVPLVSVIIGEGGSGGAVAFATADRIAMLEHSIYSVISPEGCASILWKDAEKMKEAAEALRLTAQDLLALGVIDRIVPEPKGGAQRDKPAAIARVGTALGRAPRRARRQEARRAPQGPPPQVPRHGPEVARRLGRVLTRHQGVASLARGARIVAPRSNHASRMVARRASAISEQPLSGCVEARRGRTLSHLANFSLAARRGRG